MFRRLTDCVPDIYVNESRDFQLLCRLYDTSHQSIRFDTLTMLNALSATKANNRILPLLADRMGFKHKHHIDDNVLRYILSSFPFIIKNKGNKIGIEQAVAAILKSENSLEPPIVTIDNINHTIIIATPIDIYNKTALDDLLAYVVPAGYTYQVMPGTQYPSNPQPYAVDTSVVGDIRNKSTNTETDIFSAVRYAKELADKDPYAVDSPIELDKNVSAVGVLPVFKKEEKTNGQ